MLFEIEAQFAVSVVAAAAVVVNCIDRIVTLLSTNQTKHRPFNIHCLLRAPVIRRYFTMCIYADVQCKQRGRERE